RFQSQDSLGKWANQIMSNSLSSVDGSALVSSVSSGHRSYSSLVVEDPQLSLPKQLFNLTDVFPAWVSSTEKSKILVTGLFQIDYLHISKSNLTCVCGDEVVPAEIVQDGVYRCWVPPHSPGLVNLYLSLDGHNPISQVVNFEYRTPVLHAPVASVEEKNNWDEFQLQMRLAYLLFAKQQSLDVFSSKVSSSRLKEAREFSLKTSFISNTWQYLMESTLDNKIPFSQAKDALFGIALKNRLKEWLSEKIVLGCKTTEYDAQGQSVIHLCAILGYTWAVTLFSWSGLSLDFRDKFGWTALHWAAYHGREKMVAALLSVGAKPYLVTDPTHQNPGGYTAADLAHTRGYHGLAAYLSEKFLVEQFNDMSLAGNTSGSLETSTDDPVNSKNLTEEELYLKDALAAYRTAADAAARIQQAYRKHSLKLQMVAAMKIQRAFRNFETKKVMASAETEGDQNQQSYAEEEFFKTGRKQAEDRWCLKRKGFRGLQLNTAETEGDQNQQSYAEEEFFKTGRKQAEDRWRLKRKGFRGLQLNTAETEGVQNQQSDAEEEFFKTGRKQAEDRVGRSVIRVQAMFRSKKMREDYRSMKLALNQAKMERENEKVISTEVDMGMKR
ncbi:hypothetical protein KIW84_040892, partial [Lathyrus oleraceus]